MKEFCVEAYTASWIEIFKAIVHDDGMTVEAYTASWIEIIRFCHKH